MLVGIFDEVRTENVVQVLRLWCGRWHSRSHANISLGKVRTFVLAIGVIESISVCKRVVKERQCMPHQTIVLAIGTLSLFLGNY